MHHQEKTPSLKSGVLPDSASALQMYQNVCVTSRTIKTQLKVGREKLPPRALSACRKRYHCSSHGCKQAFHSMQELIHHIKVHYRPTQSMEGKVFHCSTLGCKEVFPSMQDLMSHLKVHYKPNRYFKCENCMQHFRTHRSLFKHLHVCSDVSTNPSQQRAEKPNPPSTSDPSKPLMLEGLPKLESTIMHIKKEAIVPRMNPGTATSTSAIPSQTVTSLPGSLPSLLSSMPLVSTPHPFSLLEPSLFGTSSLTRFSSQPPTSITGPFLSYMHTSPYGLPQATVQQRLRSYIPSQGLPISNAVWKKNQGHSANSRIVWEHTRGRYNCMQCSYSTASRDEMTLHIEDHHKNPPNRLQHEIGYDVGLTPFHSKLPAEMGNSLYSQLG
ncbi:zinc finger protein 414 isoform X1 [Microcaecilia unicolor]|uniref:Zinc finger protein 414 isoform X1 n=2 Tax=Microcaecilia unicolor TaxID=1415580 RepID=A0A6P7ZF04_9AMPH|nr:zinc finger protein 414 isoform X1 [Microcaecilia unicolor]